MSQIRLIFLLTFLLAIFAAVVGCDDDKKRENAIAEKKAEREIAANNRQREDEERARREEWETIQDNSPIVVGDTVMERYGPKRLLTVEKIGPDETIVTWVDDSGYEQLKEIKRATIKTDRLTKPPITRRRNRNQ